MNITLTPELENLINEKVKSGKYDSPGEVIREGLRLLKEQDELKRIRLEELRREVQKGIDDIREGRFTVYDSPEELGEEIKQWGREELKRRQEQK
ncbi:MAG TPA: type II toxin-antitoxin system ParD family antitoxin [Pyrinomonadaceae bacterium]|nr:type II toxin-antitoxin system ParD family antitoxin [Pyrinomonadaceae bacterium]